MLQFYLDFMMMITKADESSLFQQELMRFRNKYRDDSRSIMWLRNRLWNKVLENSIDQKNKIGPSKGCSLIALVDNDFIKSVEAIVNLLEEIEMPAETPELKDDLRGCLYNLNDLRFNSFYVNGYVDDDRNEHESYESQYASIVNILKLYSLLFLGQHRIENSAKLYSLSEKIYSLYKKIKTRLDVHNFFVSLYHEDTITIQAARDIREILRIEINGEREELNRLDDANSDEEDAAECDLWGVMTKSPAVC